MSGIVTQTHTKITSQLGWEPAYTFEQGMQETIAWYLANTQWIENIVSGQFKPGTVLELELRKG